MGDRFLLENDECLRNDKNTPKELLAEFENVAVNVHLSSGVDAGTFHDAINKYCSQDNANSAVYYYHSDHLGSASWITNTSGSPVQHLQYMPYGEPLVNERTTSYEERFTFTGKERDSETGYGYFGARYYDSDFLTGWLSVDPMADKYPSLSPYAYCAWNPVKLVDPDGRDIWIGHYSENKVSKYDPNIKYAKGTLGYHLNNIYENSKAGRFVINNLINSDNDYYVSGRSNPHGEHPVYSFEKGSRQIYLNYESGNQSETTLPHELFHAFQHENNQWGKTRDCEVEAFLFAGIVLTQMNGDEIPNSISQDYWPYLMFDSGSTKGKKYHQNMLSLTKSFDLTKMNYVVSHFLNNSMSGLDYSNNTGYSYSLQGEKYSSNKSLLNKYSSKIY